METSFMEQAVRLSFEGQRAGLGGPFGAVVVKDGRIVGRGHNQVTSTNDPTAHAEVVAIRDACRNLGTFQLTGCEIYTSCEPCPMCLGAIFWARPDAVYYACTHADASDAGFDDSFIYEQVALSPEKRTLKMVHLPWPEAREAFEEWKRSGGKTDY
ncbi:MAG: nucleoside deaminase [Siphonobacter aquaeclarae]|jgi:guanine deaminase|nr:nucleoside deaminase [Siphonobacter aquaeclarae]